MLVGELSLDGTIHPARGVLPIAAAARKSGAAALLLPAPNAAEAAVVGELRLLPVRTLTEAVSVLNRAPSQWPEATIATAPARRSTHAIRRSIFAISAGRRSRAGRWRSPLRAATTC